MFGFQDIVERELKEGKTYEEIKRIIKAERPFLYRASEIKRDTIKSHLTHSGINMDNVRIVKKARRELSRERITAAEIGDMAIGYLSKALAVKDSITDEDVEALGPEAKFKVASQGLRDFISTQKLAMEAEKTQALKQKWLHEIGELASGKEEEKDAADTGTD
jgi:LytS/YehU family sensor histidine kinase